MTAETHGPQLPPEPKRPKPPWREIEARWLIGELGRDDICRIYGLARTTVFAHLRREKLQERRAEYTEALRREVVERIAGPVAERVVRQLEESLDAMKTLRQQIVAAGAANLTSAASQVLRAEAEVLLKLGKGIQLLEPDAPTAAGDSGATSFVRDVQAASRAIESDATSSDAIVIDVSAEDASPHGDALHPEP